MKDWPLYFSGIFEDTSAGHEWTSLPLATDARITEFITDN